MTADYSLLLQKAILKSKERGTHDLQTSFSNARSEAESNGHKDLSQCFFMLSSIFSMYFQFKPDAPFGPMFTTENGRSFLPEDLTDDDLNRVEELTTLSNDPVFTSRMYDTLWLRRLDPSHARKAVDSYLNASQVEVHWVESVEFLKRAAQISSQLGRHSEEKSKVSTFILNEFSKWESNCFNTESDFRPLKYVKILIEERLVVSDWEDIGSRCLKIAEGFPKQPFCTSPRSYLEIAAECFRKAGKTEKAKQVLISRAQHFEAEAGQFQELGNGFNASDRYQEAIKAYSDLGMGEKVEGLAAPLKRANTVMIGQLKPVEVKMDTQPHIDQAKKMMSGKAGVEALEMFVALNELQSFTRECKNADELAEKHPLQSIIGAVHVAPEGNISARVPGIMEDPESARIAKVVQNYGLIHGFIGSTWLNTGRLAILEDESKAWIKALQESIAKSSFVPDDRRIIYERALTAGMEGDGLVFLHLIIPQLENSIRYIASKANVKVTSLKNSGAIQEEMDLGSLLLDGEIQKLLGEDLTWELRSMLTEKTGPNLRNRVCHGLVAPYQDSMVCYLLWLVLVILFTFKDQT